MRSQRGNANNGTYLIWPNNAGLVYTPHFGYTARKLFSSQIWPKKSFNITVPSIIDFINRVDSQ